MSKVFEIRIPNNMLSLDNFNDSLFNFLCDLNKLSDVKCLDREDIDTIKKGFNLFKSFLVPYLSYDLYKVILNNDINKDIKKAIDCFFKLKEAEKTFMEEFNHD